MKSVFLFLPFLVVLAIFVPARADQDDNDNNADLQDTPEEIARATVLKRWPDATEIDVLDLAEDEQDDADDDDATRPADAVREDDSSAIRQRLAELGDDFGEVQDGDELGMDDDDPDADAANDFTLSVTFQTKGLEYEALMNDKGVIRYVYEEIPVEDAPLNVMKAARAAVKEGDFIYVDKVLNETKKPFVTSYIVGVGEKDVYLDCQAKVLKVEDAPKDDDQQNPDKKDDEPLPDGML